MLVGAELADGEDLESVSSCVRSGSFQSPFLLTRSSCGPTNFSINEGFLFPGLF